MNTNYPNYFKTLCLLFFLLSGHNNVFTQAPSYTANDQVTTYADPFRYGTNSGYYPGWTDGQLGDLAAGNPTLGIPGIGAKAFRPALFEHYLEQYGYSVNIPWFQHYQSLGMEDNTVFVGYPSPDHQDPAFHCASRQSTAFANMYEPIWDGGANGTPVNDDNYYALYLYKMVTLYKDYVKFWEIWNEPDLDFSPQTMGWRFPGDPEGSWWDENPEPCHTQWGAPIFFYNRLLRISWEVIKTVDPDAYVTTGGLGYPSFLDAMMRNTDNPVDGSVTAEYPLKAGAYFDVLSFHSYPHLDGSLLIWDHPLPVSGYQRHTDRAIEGVTLALNRMKTVLAEYGYDGTTYPEKEVILTESSIPRKKFNDYIGSEIAASNYAIKLPIELQREGVRQFHYYDLGEKQTYAEATWHFNMTGFYEKLEGTAPADIQRTNSGIAYKTVSDMLYGKFYDEAQSASLNLPSNIDGAAFKDDNNQFTYILWAKTYLDDSEETSATYSFPSSLNLSQLEKRNWDFAETNQQSIISPENIMLDGSPIFLIPSNQQVSFSCPTDIIIEVNANQNGEVVTWSPPTATTLCASGSVSVLQTGGLNNGGYFPVGTSTVTYEISDNCGNVEACSFTITVNQNNTNPPTDCPSNKNKVTVTIVGNGAVDVEFVNPSEPTQTCSEGTCTYCVDNGAFIKLIPVPNPGESFQGWNGGGCSGTDDCLKFVSWETDITATFSENLATPIQLSTDVTDVSCNGGSDGNVILNVSGGAPNYTFNWSNGQSISHLNNVPTGTYVVTVTDIFGATATTSATVNQPPALAVLISSQTNTTCQGNNDGSAAAIASGGTAPYQYLWSNSLNFSPITDLLSGDYTVTATDANGCTATVTANVLDPIAILPTVDFSKDINGLDVVFTDISTDNPTSWTWEFGDGNSSGSANPTHTYAAAGNYLVCLTASNDCGENGACQNISVGQTSNISIQLSSQSGNAGEVVQVPVLVENFNNVISFQHSFYIPDTTLAVFVDTSDFAITELGNAAAINVTNQEVKTSWLTVSGAPATLIDSSAMYYLEVLIKGGLNECVDIIMNTQTFPTEFVVIDNGNIAQIGYDFMAGEVCANPGVSIAGIIETENGLPIESVEILDANSFLDMSDINGDYAIPPAPMGRSFVITPHKDVNYINGVTSYDLAIIQQHIVGNIFLDSPYKIIAADVDNSKTISSIDLWLAQQAIIGNVDTFPNNESWRFVPTDFVFVDPTDPFTPDFPEHITLNDVNFNFANQDFVAIKIGDVNHTALPNALQNGDAALNRNSMESFDLVWKKEKTNADEFYIEFLAKDFKNRSAFQFDLFFEKNQFEFLRLEEMELDVKYGKRWLEEGILNLIWYGSEVDGKSLEDESGLFRIYFKGKMNPVAGEETIQIIEKVTPPVIFDHLGNPNKLTMSFLEKEDQQNVYNSSIIVFQNQPNPFYLNTKIYFNMVIEDLVQVRIYDLNGRNIYSTEKVFPKGMHQIEIDAKDFPNTGMYYYSFTTSSDRVVKKMVVQN